MSNPSLIRNFKAEAAVAAYTIVKPGTADGQVLAAAAVSDKSIGITTDIAAAINERCDVILSGVADVLYGGTVTRGDLLTADASGRAVTAAPAAGANNRIIGIALVSGVVGDVGQIEISQGMLQG
ncbi:MAG: capsid cement protein [Pseudomonadota bacterium]